MDIRGGKDKGKVTEKSETVDDFEHAYATGATPPHRSRSRSRSRSLPNTNTSAEHPRSGLTNPDTSTTTTTTTITTAAKHTHAHTSTSPSVSIPLLPHKTYILRETLFKPIPTTHALAICTTRRAAQQTLRYLAAEIGARPVHYVPEGKKRAVRTVRKVVSYRRAGAGAGIREGHDCDSDCDGEQQQQQEQEQDSRNEFGFEAWIEEKNELVLKITARKERSENADKECVVLGLQVDEVDGEMVRELLKSKKTDGQKASQNGGKIG